MFVLGTRCTIAKSDDPIITERGWVAVRGPGTFTVLISAAMPEWRQAVAPLEAATDSEYYAYVLTLPREEQQRRSVITEAAGGYLSHREAMIAHRSALGMASRYDQFVKSLPIPEQTRRLAPAAGHWTVDVPAFA